MKIKVMSVHVTPDCNLDCEFCYARDKDRRLSLDWFMDVPEIAKELGVEQIPIGGGEPTLYQDFLHRFTHRCRDKGILPNLTTNGSIQIKEEVLENIGCVSFSIDLSKIKRVQLRSILDNVNRAIMIRKTNMSEFPRTGINFLLLNSYSLMNLPLMCKTLLIDNDVDYVYVLQPKNVETDISPDLLKKILYPISVLLGDRLLVDDSITLSLGIKDYCHYGDSFCSLYYDGSIRGCSFSEPIAYVNTPSDIIDVIKSKFPLEKRTICPYVKYVTVTR